MKKALLWIVVLVLSISMVAAFSFAGCKKETAPAKEEVVAGEEAAETTTAKQEEPVKLTYLSLAWLKGEQDVTKQVIDEWNKQHPEIQVEYVQGDWGTIAEYLLTSFETGDVPDMFQYQAISITDWKDRGVLVDMTPMLDTGMKDDVLPGFWQMLTTKDNRIIGLPFEFETDSLFYNKAIFAEKGIQVPDLNSPWSLDELIEVAQKLTDPTQGKYGVALAGMGLSIEVINDTWATKIGFSPVTKEGDNMVVKVNNPKYLDLMKKIHDMIYVQKVTPADVVGIQYDATPGFLEGKYAIVAGWGCWMRALITESAKGKNIDWGLLPPIKIDTASTYGQLQTISICEKSAHKNEAMEFLKYFWNTENQIKIAKSAYLFPGRLSAVNSKEFSTSEEGWDMAQSAAKNLVVPLHVITPGWGAFFNGIGATIYQEYFSDQITLEQFVEKCEREGTKALKEEIQ